MFSKCFSNVESTLTEFRNDNWRSVGRTIQCWYNVQIYFNTTFSSDVAMLHVQYFVNVYKTFCAIRVVWFLGNYTMIDIVYLHINSFQLQMFFRSSSFSQCTLSNRFLPQLYFMIHIQSSTWRTLHQFLEKTYQSIPNYIVVKVYRSNGGRVYSTLYYSRSGIMVFHLDEWFPSITLHLLFSCSLLQSVTGPIVISSFLKKKIDEKLMKYFEVSTVLEEAWLKLWTWKIFIFHT